MHILLVEDDRDLGEAVTAHLVAAGHRVAWCQGVATARELAADLVLLDLGLPDGDGAALLRDWRARGDSRPVIVISARDQLAERIRGLQTGADDYIVKPFDLDELLARIDAVARRSAAAAPPNIGVITIDAAAHQLRRAGAAIDLTAMEWAVLACLARRPGRIWSRGEIEQALIADGLGGEADSNSLEVIVSRLRKKLGTAAISTHRGLGYRLDVPLGH